MLSEKFAKVVELAKAELGVRTQGDFAQSIGMTADRAKNLAAGKVKRITTDEMRAIEALYGVRTSWWANDDAPMLLTDLERTARVPLSQLAEVTQQVVDLGLEEAQSRTLQEVLYATRRKDTGALNRLLSPAMSSDDDYIRVPRYDVRASAGHGQVIHNESVVDHLAFRRDWVSKAVGCDPDHLALIEVRGDSMAPTINDSDVVLLDIRPTERRSEGVYVINLRGVLLVKRVRIRLTGIVDVISDNPQYGSEAISGEDLDRLVIVGRVVWHGKKF